MRTTLTIDDDLYAAVEEAARQRRVSVREYIQDALRQSLAPARKRPPFRVRVHHSALQPGIDPRRLNQLADELEEEGFAHRRAR